MRIGFNQLFHPTPTKIQLVGKTFRTAAVAAAGIAATTGVSGVTCIVLVAVGFIGDFLCNFAGSDNVSTEVINKPDSPPVKADVETNPDTGSKTVV